MRIFIITILCLVLAAPASAGLYKWKDKEGKIHFTDSINKVPLNLRSKKQVKKMPPSRLIKSSPRSEESSAPVQQSTPRPHSSGKKACDK